LKLTGVEEGVLLERKLALARRILEAIATFPESEHAAAANSAPRRGASCWGRRAEPPFRSL
jgi:hypothetical protein